MADGILWKRENPVMKGSGANRACLLAPFRLCNCWVGFPERMSFHESRSRVRPLQNVDQLKHQQVIRKFFFAKSLYRMTPLLEWRLAMRNPAFEKVSSLASSPRGSKKAGKGIDPKEETGP
ncbi:hypothetical protein COLO4_02858 [Corchorus olitorius]|uniref:Uncharacterized protein n=1 Tax=Corchorus olitorius TaxID=93759 RepID=A0A1R3L068_9ROSI|nr:hypothetical protein COLO4_02858 [Corchorus olitorius]